MMVGVAMLRAAANGAVWAVRVVAAVAEAAGVYVGARGVRR